MLVTGRLGKCFIPARRGLSVTLEYGENAMRIDPMVVALGALICLIPVGFGILIANWRLPWTDEQLERTVSLTEMVLRDEGDVLSEEPPHDQCDCAACTFWFEWHRMMA